MITIKARHFKQKKFYRKKKHIVLKIFQRYWKYEDDSCNVFKIGFNQRTTAVSKKMRNMHFCGNMISNLLGNITKEKVRNEKQHKLKFSRRSDMHSIQKIIIKWPVLYRTWECRGNVTKTRNTVVSIGSLIIDWIRV